MLFSCSALYWAIYMYKLLDCLQESFWIGVNGPHFTEEKTNSCEWVTEDTQLLELGLEPLS